jgi:hypothetical protein
MEKLIIVHVGEKRIAGYEYINVMRPNTLGNPFYMKSEKDRIEVLRKFKLYLWKEMNTPGSKVLYALNSIIEMLLNGRGVALVCCCKPKACHGDIIKAAIEYIMNRK